MCAADFVRNLSAFATPIVRLIAAGLGSLIAYRQWRTAQNRLKLDLFDRRLPVYQETRDFLARRMAMGQLKDSDIAEFAVGMRVSRWLFNPSIADYLEEEIAKKAMFVNSLNSELGTLVDEKAREQNVAQQREIKNWSDAQLCEVIDAKFAEFLVLTH